MARKEVLAGCIRVGDLVFTGGVTGRPGDAKTQIRNTLEKIKSVLQGAGASMENVVKANVYLRDIGDRERYLNDLWREYFPKDPPARTCLQAGLSPETYVEIEVVAVVPSK